MQKERQGCHGRLLLVSLAVLACLSAVAFAQDVAPPRTEIYVGYAWQDPGIKFSGTSVGGMAKGFDIQTSYFFTKYFGLTADSGTSFKDRRANLGTILGGPTVRFPMENVTPFLHALVGLHRVVPAAGFPGNPQTNNGVGAAIGGGLDLRLSRLFDVRLLQADYMWGHHNYQPGIGTREAQGGRLSGGIVLKLGSLGPPPPPPAASCGTATPAEVMAGEPVSVTVTPSDFNPKATLTYSWTTSGGKAAGTSATTQVDTAGLAPGSYTVTSNVSGGKYAGKPASATCSASFTVKEPPKNPPTISCSANPTTVKSGEPSTVSCNATSPDNRPVNVTYSASGGKISGNGNQATLDTAGAAAGPITVTGTATDDRGLTNSGTATVNVEVPPPPPQASKLNEITFKDTKRPARVDNEAKAILDDVALRLQREPDSKAVIIGHASASEMQNKRGKPIKGLENLAAQRAVNTKDYLVTEKGIDGNRIEVRTSTAEGNTSEIYIVPAGATYAGEGTTVVPEGSVKAQPRKPLPTRHHRRARAKKAAPAQ